MADPITLVLGAAAVGGAAGRVTEKAIDYLHDRFKGEDAAVQKNAAENTLGMLVELRSRIAALEASPRIEIHQHLEAVLLAPDTADVLKAAILGAARSTEPRKQQLIGRAVAERLAAPTESLHAIASAQAVEILPRLTVEHLEYLGIAALVYAARPPGLPLSSAPSRDQGSPADDLQSLRTYPDWLAARLRAVPLDMTIADSDLAHLHACSCLVWDRRSRRDLLRTLLPFGGRRLTMMQAHGLPTHIGNMLVQTSHGRQLKKLWDDSLQHVTLTPAGVLIGIGVLDIRTNAETDLSAIPSVYSEPDADIDDSVWDGRRIREDFLKALDAAIKNRIERGVGIWRKVIAK